MNCIQKKRVAAQITQERLAQLLNVDRSTVAKWETKKSYPRAEVLIKMAEVLNCTVDELLRDDEEIITCSAS